MLIKSIISILLITLLSSSVLAVKIDIQPNSIELPQEKVGDAQCVLCQYVVVYAEKFIAGNHSVSDIINALDQYCAMLPGTYGANCQTLVNSFGSIIIAKIIEFETPQVICAQLMLCQSSTALEMQEQVPVGKVEKHHFPIGHHHIGKKVECKACKFVTDKAIHYISSGKTDAEIEAYLDKDCDAFSIAAGICKNLVHHSIKDLVRDLRNHVSADDACRHIHMC